jgi:hypothetical protein
MMAAITLAPCGCATTVASYFQNGCKVGPNYTPPTTPEAPKWLDEDDPLPSRQSEHCRMVGGV